MRDNFSQIKHVLAVAPAARDATPSITGIDLRGFQSCVFEILTGAGGITFTTSNKIEWTLTECDTVDGSYTPVAAEYVQLQVGESYGAGGIVRAHTAAHAAASSRKVGYTGYKPFVKMVPVYGGEHGEDTITAATAVLGHPLTAPVA